MSKGETAKLEIEPEWAYGRKGLPENKYPFSFGQAVEIRLGSVNTLHFINNNFTIRHVCHDGVMFL